MLSPGELIEIFDARIGEKRMCMLLGYGMYGDPEILYQGQRRATYAPRDEDFNIVPGTPIVNKSVLDAGYVYAPYIPMNITPTIFDPSDFKPRKGIMSRYGKKIVKTEYYGHVTLSEI